MRADVVRRPVPAGTGLPLSLLAGLWVVFTLGVPGFGGADTVFGVLQGFAFLGLVALALGVTMIAGELDLSVGSVAALAGIGAVTLLPLGLLPAVGLTVAGAAAFGAFQGFIIAVLRINSLVLTIGTMFAVRGLAHVMSGGAAVQVPVADLDLADALIARIGVFSPFSLVTLVVLAVCGVLLVASRWGRELLAVGGGREESAAAGVPQRRPVVLAFTSSAATAALAGSLASLASGSGAPGAFGEVLLAAITAALVGGIGLYGGRGSVLNVVMGVLVVSAFGAGLAGAGAPEQIQQLALGGLLLFVVLAELAGPRLPARRPTVGS